MGCACGKRRSATPKAGDLLGYSVTYPDGTTSPAPYMTIAEAKAEIRMAGGGTIRKLVRKE